MTRFRSSLSLLLIICYAWVIAAPLCLACPYHSARSAQCHPEATSSASSCKAQADCHSCCSRKKSPCSRKCGEQKPDEKNPTNARGCHNCPLGDANSAAVLSLVTVANEMPLQASPLVKRSVIQAPPVFNPAFIDRPAPQAFLSKHISTTVLLC